MIETRPSDCLTKFWKPPVTGTVKRRTWSSTRNSTLLPPLPLPQPDQGLDLKVARGLDLELPRGPVVRVGPSSRAYSCEARARSEA